MVHHSRDYIAMGGHEVTYSDNGRVVGDPGRLVLLGARRSFDSEIFYIGASEDDVLVDLIGRRDLLLEAPLPALGAV